MSNLGDSNTPVEGESFGLPAGAELTEDADGNLAIADSSGSIVLVRDETAGAWDFQTNDLENVGGIDATGLTSDLDVAGNSLTGINAINASSANVEDARVENTSCMIGLGSNQTIQNDTFTIVEFSDTSGDRHNQIGFDTTNNKYVATDEQTVSICVNLCWDNEVNGQIRLQFLKNGNVIPGGRIVVDGTDGSNESVLSYRNVKLQENDELEVQTRQRHGDVQDLRSADNDTETYVAIRRL